MPRQPLGVDVTLPLSNDWIDRTKQQARDNMVRYDSCTQSLLASFMTTLDIDDPLLMRSAGALHGGMVSSLTCGIHTAGLMVLGLFLGRESIEDGLDGLFPMVLPAQELVRRLTRRLGSSSCREMTVALTGWGKAPMKSVDLSLS